ncbi:prolyl oligopeptidase family serine peptidase [Planctomycetota bacterium]
MKKLMQLYFLLALMAVISGLSGMPILSAKGKPDLRMFYRQYELKCVGQQIKLGKFCATKKNYSQAMNHFKTAQKLDPGNLQVAKEIKKIEGKENVPFEEKNLEAYQKKIITANKTMSKELAKVASLFVQTGRRYGGYTLAKRALEMDEKNKSASKITSSMQEEVGKIKKDIKQKIKDGKEKHAEFDEGIAELPFFIKFPKKFKTDKLWPVIIHVHGAGDKGSNAVTYFAPLRESGYVICAPSFGYSGQNASTTIEHDDQSLLKIVDYIVDHYAIDPSRIYLTSHSAGGYILYPAIGKHGDVFSAFIAFNSVYPGNSYTKQKPPNAKPILLIEGTKDHNRGITARAKRALENANFNKITFLELEGVEHNDLNASYDEIQDWLKKTFPEGK